MGHVEIWFPRGNLISTWAMWKSDFWSLVPLVISQIFWKCMEIFQWPSLLITHTGLCIFFIRNNLQIALITVYCSFDRISSSILWLWDENIYLASLKKKKSTSQFSLVMFWTFLLKVWIDFIIIRPLEWLLAIKKRNISKIEKT